MATRNAQPDTIEAFKQQIEMMDVMYMSLIRQCREKCVTKDPYADGELNKGQSVCLDRCVSKYFSVFERVNQQLMEKGMADPA